MFRQPPIFTPVPYPTLFRSLVTFLSGTSAFYFGRSLGRRPLYPAVSTKKTWEGLGGSVLGGGVTAGLFAGFFLNAPWYEATGLGLFLGLWQAGGDLFESMLKRTAGIKDSGRILMGHGGLWDRLAALLFNLPLVFLFAFFRG